MNRIVSQIAAWAALAFVLALLVIPFGATRAAEGGSATEPATDVYYKTSGVPQGPAAPAGDPSTYPRYGSLDNRTLTWFVTQQHTSCSKWR